MKKLVISILLVLILCLFNYYKEDKSMSVMREIDNSYQVYYIMFDNKLNANNFNDYFNENIKIIGIYPYISNLDKLIIKDNLYYEFSPNKNNIINFSDYVVKIYEHYNLKARANEIKLNGVEIRVVKVYSCKNIMDEFSKKYDVNYTNTL